MSLRNGLPFICVAIPIVFIGSYSYFSHLSTTIQYANFRICAQITDEDYFVDHNTYFASNLHEFLFKNNRKGRGKAKFPNFFDFTIMISSFSFQLSGYSDNSWI